MPGGIRVLLKKYPDELSKLRCLREDQYAQTGLEKIWEDTFGGRKIMFYLALRYSRTPHRSLDPIKVGSMSRQNMHRTANLCYVLVWLSWTSYWSTIADTFFPVSQPSRWHQCLQHLPAEPIRIKKKQHFRQFIWHGALVLHYSIKITDDATIVRNQIRKQIRQDDHLMH